MDKIIEKALNRGVPIDTPVEIDLHEFLKLFDKEELYKEYRNSIKEIVSRISNIIELFGGEIVLPLTATISIEKNNSKTLQFSGENYFLSIFGILKGIDRNEVMNIFGDPQKFTELKEQIMSIKTPEELKKQMPRLYELYLNQLECNKNFLELEELVNDEKVPFNIKIENLSRITNNFKELYSNFDLKREQQFAKDFTLTLYLEKVMKALENMLTYASQIIKIYQDYSLDLKSFDQEDEDKLNLYIAAKFMEQAEIEKVEDKQRYLFYLTNYFKENVETKITRVNIKLYEKKVNPIILYQRYKKLLVENPSLLAVNFSYTDFKNMSQEEIEEFITAYLAELSANWELIPNDDASVEKSVRSSIKRNYRNISLEERKQREEKLINLYIQKKNFYDATDPYFRIKGKQTFDGYVGYIYSNALVILEKFYDNANEAKIADNEAVYIISMKDFYDLSRHSKSYLIANHLCKRVIHKGLWQQRVLEYINKKDTMINPVDDTNKLIEEKKVYINEKKI